MNPQEKLQPTVTANDLAGAVTPPKLTPPQQPSIPRSLSGMVSSVRDAGNQILQAQTEEAKQLKELRAQQASLSGEGTLSDLYNNLSSQYQLPDNMKQLQDIQLQLSDNKTQSELTKSRIAGASGQTATQAGREITQEEREQAVRDAGLAARAAVLQGNIETASSLVNQAVSIAYQDRTLRNQNLISQINDLRGTVDNQTQQLLDQEQRKYEEDLAQIQRIQDAVDEAMLSGAATQQDIAKLTSPNISDDERLALAQAISARGASQMRNLDIAQKQASIRASNASANASETKRLLDLAAAGDQDAMSQLGLSTDPDMRQYQLATTDIQMGVNAAQRALDQIEGLKLSTGAYQNPLAAATLQSVGLGITGGAAIGSLAGGVGAVPGAIAGGIAGLAATPMYYSRTKTAKDEFLGAATFLVNDTTFQEIRDLKAQGVTFGNMTEGERIAAGRAAQALNSAAEVDESGTVTGFKGNPETIQGYLQDIKVAYEARQEYLDSQTFISPDEQTEAQAVWNNN